jgi:nitroreductase
MRGPQLPTCAVGAPDGGTPELEHVTDLAKARRSVREYTAQPVDRGLVMQLCEAAAWAPSNWNGQPWQFIVIDDPAVRGRVCALLDDRADEVAGSGGDVRLVRFVEHCRRYFRVLHECSVLVLACYKPAGRIIEEAVAERLNAPGATAAFNPNLLSLGMAAQNFLLAAHAAGLGACFHSGPVAFLRGHVNALLGLPPRLELAGVITLGWPSPCAAPRTVTRKPLDHLVRFGDSTRT